MKNKIMANSGLKLDTRRRKILEFLRVDGKVRVSSLSEQLGTSVVTIRSDLAKLERDGYLERIPGGAIQTMKNYYNMDFQQRKSTNTSRKQAIAVGASQLVEDGETLMINSGTTTYFTASELKRFNHLKIVTNSIIIATELSSYPNLHITLLGGETNPQYSFTYGTNALKQLRQYKADKVILSVDGISDVAGLSTYHAEEAEISHMMLERSFCSIVVADSTKIGHESFSNIDSIERVDYLVTNKDGGDAVTKALQTHGIEIIYC